MTNAVFAIFVAICLGVMAFTANAIYEESQKDYGRCEETYQDWRSHKKMRRAERRGLTLETAGPQYVGTYCSRWQFHDGIPK